MVKKLMWKNQRLRIVKKHFASSGGLTVFLMDDTNYPVLRVNHNPQKQNLNLKEIIVNNHNSNEGIKEKLIIAGYLSPTNKWVEIENELCEICVVI